ncbi:SDR family NAD(P)-dependent oxidoreductase [Cyanobacterium stanieri LEGE 03274]|uniref:SDR family NAD(P)-dependent oxidoreductase n=1 Tax=Cyanobacterium stanieri LEGE 03274 TaxID=1828756 RepID=A0ABR9V4M3_9CHRO|nr:SDR family NAD(P)-dependent oxidoreductase [Cyanobacterium stanieri]MBE9222787.1 SDR family NAD(P)-dependent oxidoreductase [Cyanobacterium stanieri LEGE 03274]
MSHQHCLILGASQGIGLGFVKQLAEDNNYQKIYSLYRNKNNAEKLFQLQQQYPHKIHCIQGDITQEKDIINLVEKIKSTTNQLHLVINCVGILHQGEIQPEKSLKHIHSPNLLHYFQVNAIPTVLLAKHLLPLLKHSQKSIFATISAKVGSIEDNYLGGWYGYRASKSALNMFIKNIAIEYNRVSKNTIVIALHPGTTDTQLSQPFQGNVPPEKLFSVERCTSQLLLIINRLTKNDHGKFFSWDGSILPW